jgi:hypothetical protein
MSVLPLLRHFSAWFAPSETAAVALILQKLKQFFYSSPNYNYFVSLVSTKGLPSTVRRHCDCLSYSDRPATVLYQQTLAVALYNHTLAVVLYYQTLRIDCLVQSDARGCLVKSNPSDCLVPSDTSDCLVPSDASGFLVASDTNIVLYHQTLAIVLYHETLTVVFYCQIWAVVLCRQTLEVVLQFQLLHRFIIGAGVFCLASRRCRVCYVPSKNTTVVLCLQCSGCLALLNKKDVFLTFQAVQRFYCTLKTL